MLPSTHPRPVACFDPMLHNSPNRASTRLAAHAGSLAEYDSRTRTVE